MAQFPAEVRLQKWLDGTIKVPEDKRLYLLNGKLYPLNYYYGNEGRPDPKVICDVDAVGVLLDVRRVKNDIVIIVGFEDAGGSHFYVPFTLGNIDDKGLSPSFAVYNTRSLQWINNPQKRIPQSKAKDILHPFIGKMGMFHILYSTGGFDISQISSLPPKKQLAIQREMKHLGAGQAFEEFLWKINHKRINELSSDEIPSFINQNPEDIDPAKLPLDRDVWLSSAN